MRAIFGTGRCPQAATEGVSIDEPETANERCRSRRRCSKRVRSAQRDGPAKGLPEKVGSVHRGPGALRGDACAQPGRTPPPSSGPAAASWGGPVPTASAEAPCSAQLCRGVLLRAAGSGPRGRRFLRRDGTRSRQQDRVRSRHQRRSSSCITSSRRSAAGSGCSTPPNRSGAVAPSANSLARGARGRQAADANPTVHRQDRYLVGWCPQAPVFRVSSSTADGFVKVLMRRIVHVNEVSSRHTVEVVSDPNAEGYAGRSRCRHATSASGVRKPGRRLPSR